MIHILLVNTYMKENLRNKGKIMLKWEILGKTKEKWVKLGKIGKSQEKWEKFEKFGKIWKNLGKYVKIGKNWKKWENWKKIEKMEKIFFPWFTSKKSRRPLDANFNIPNSVGRTAMQATRR